MDERHAALFTFAVARMAPSREGLCTAGVTLTTTKQYDDVPYTGRAAFHPDLIDVAHSQFRADSAREPGQRWREPMMPKSGETPGIATESKRHKKSLRVAI